MSELNVRDKNPIDFLLTRRSTVAKRMDGPGPSEVELQKILKAGMRVPDHGQLTPWRFIVLRGDAREKIGAVIAASYRNNNPEATEERIKIEQERLTRAPVVVAVLSRVQKGHKIPEWEQVLSAGAVCQTMLIASQSMGYAAQWLTEWCAYDADVKSAIGAAAGDEIAGYVYIGNEIANGKERARPKYENIVLEWPAVG